MSQHPWTKVEVDGGPLGVGQFWHCPVCGVGGGPAWDAAMEKRLEEKGVKKRWQPFIVGHGRRVSEDCEEAQKEIRAYAEETIARFREKWKTPRGEHSHYHSLTPSWKQRTPRVDQVIETLFNTITDVYPPRKPRDAR